VNLQYAKVMKPDKDGVRCRKLQQLRQVAASRGTVKKTVATLIKYQHPCTDI